MTDILGTELAWTNEPDSIWHFATGGGDRGYVIEDARHRTPARVGLAVFGHDDEVAARDEAAGFKLGAGTVEDLTATVHSVDAAKVIAQAYENWVA